MSNIHKFLYYALCPRLVIRCYARRKRKGNKVILCYNQLRRVLFDQTHRKRIRARRHNIKLWSSQMVRYIRSRHGVREYVKEYHGGASSSTESADFSEAMKSDGKPAQENNLPPEELSKQMKMQLQLLKSGKRTVALMQEEIIGDKEKDKTVTEEEKVESPAKTLVASGNTDKSVNDTGMILTNDRSTTRIKNAGSSLMTTTNGNDKLNQILTTGRRSTRDSGVVRSSAANRPNEALQNNLETTPIKQIVACGNETGNFLENLLQKSRKLTPTSEKTDEGEMSEENHLEKSSCETSAETCSASSASNKARGNFLDMLMNKVGGKNKSNTEITPKILDSKLSTDIHDESMDSDEEFLGFEDNIERTPGMLLTPVVPANRKSKDGPNSAAFISESLNEYMRENLLDTTKDPTLNTTVLNRKVRQSKIDALVTPQCVPPHMDMPALPESLQRLRTVAERRNYLSKCSKSHRLTIINNEATIYKELHRKIRLQKSKCNYQQTHQSQNSQMPFTRNGWQAASFIATEFNKYYYQMLEVDGAKTCVRLPGCLGNNEDRLKRPHNSKPTVTAGCSRDCRDLQMTENILKPIKTLANKTKLNKTPLKPVLAPCPLSYKPFQKPVDDETAALLLAGGSMAVVRMPTVELEVFPEIGKPLNEVAQRYLQYILQHHDITREWAEFSVSTLQPETTNSADKRKSFTFAIPYLNDRNHILVRRVVDRSEKLDASFEQAATMATEDASKPVEDLSFRSVLKDNKDPLLNECADVVSDLINCVAISCSENSFIRDDPDNIYSKVVKTKDEDKAELKAELTKAVVKVDLAESKPITAVGVAPAANVSQASKKQTRLL